MDRRSAIITGLGIMASASLARRGGAAAWMRRDAVPPTIPGDPVLRLASLGPSEQVGGLPTAPTWFGDSFPSNALPFHACENCDGPGSAPSEHVDVAIIGGGLSGLATAHALRHRNVVLMDLRPRVGGNAMGESWRSLRWSMASAYFMAPDRGSDLDTLYRDLGIDHHVRVDDTPTTFAWKEMITRELLGTNPSAAEREGLARYQAAVAFHAGRGYPEIPFTGAPGPNVAALDDMTFRAHIESVCGTVPPRLNYALQAYCASSFGVGTDEVNAAAGWNFVAAEEFGRWVLPGGNSELARALWKQSARTPHSGEHHHETQPVGVDFRPQCTVTDVERAKDGAIIRWRDGAGTVRRLHARHVVCAGSKHIVKYMIPWLAEDDKEKLQAMQQVQSVPYLVANVILSRPVPANFYDLFVAGGSTFPMDSNQFEAAPVITDMVNGSYAGTEGQVGSVLTMYWPLPWHTARFAIVDPASWRTWAARGSEQIAALLPLLGRSTDDVLQVRWTRWGHAMPVATPGWYASGAPELLRRPLNGCVWFANQDNWLLPAVETCLLEGRSVAAQINAALG